MEERRTTFGTVCLYREAAPTTFADFLVVEVPHESELSGTNRFQDLVDRGIAEHFGGGFGSLEEVGAVDGAWTPGDRGLDGGELWLEGPASSVWVEGFVGTDAPAGSPEAQERWEAVARIIKRSVSD